MLSIVIFAVLAVLLVGAVLLRNTRTRTADPGTRTPRGTAGASRTSSGSAARLERKKRRTQSRKDRRKRH